MSTRLNGEQAMEATMARSGPSQPSSDPSSGGKKHERVIAVALEHDDEHDAPRITATGKGKVAEQILEIAFANGVNVREDADLAEVLLALEVDSIIPVEVLATIADILAYVYRANGEGSPESSAP